MAMKLLHGINIITMDANTSVLMDGALVVLNDKIHALGSNRQIMEEYAKQADELLDLSGRWIIPGLINTHVHTSQQLGRGIADDVDLLTWLHKRIWPYESNMTEEDSYISTLLCGLELIHSGVTCFAEAGGQHVVSMVQAVEQLGIRACLTRSTMDSGEGLPSSWAAETADYCLKVQEKLFKEHNNKAEGRIRIWFGLRQILNATDKLLLLTKEAAERYKTGIHMHVAEIAYENQWVSSTRGVEHGTVTFLDKIGLLGDNLLAAHSVWLNGDEVDVTLLESFVWGHYRIAFACREQYVTQSHQPLHVNLYARHGVKVSHCPAAAMRMLGFAPIQEMLNAGICVGIGTDGAPSNNRMSIVDEMYLASLINKGRASFVKGATDPTLLPAETVLRMATINGAKAVLWDDGIGSLEVGKKADLVVINPQRWSMVPLHDPIGSLVSSMRTENIESVMCNGKWIMKDQKVLTVDEEYILRKAQQLGEGVLLRAGIKLPRRMVVC